MFKQIMSGLANKKLAVAKAHHRSAEESYYTAVDANFDTSYLAVLNEAETDLIAATDALMQVQLFQLKWTNKNK